jgi:hypothetical protein
LCSRRVILAGDATGKASVVGILASRLVLRRFYPHEHAIRV